MTRCNTGLADKQARPESCLLGGVFEPKRIEGRNGRYIMTNKGGVFRSVKVDKAGGKIIRARPFWAAVAAVRTARKPYRVEFSVLKYGEQRARELALKARRRMTRYILGVTVPKSSRAAQDKVGQQPRRQNRKPVR